MGDVFKMGECKRTRIEQCSKEEVSITMKEASFTWGVKKEEEKKEDDKKKEEDSNTINFHPKLEKCNLFLKEALSMIVGSTNKVCNLEDDLMPFL